MYQNKYIKYKHKYLNLHGGTIDDPQVKPIFNKQYKRLFKNKLGQWFYFGDVNEITNPDNEFFPTVINLETEYFYYFSGYERFESIGYIKDIDILKKIVTFTTLHKYISGGNNFILGKRIEVLDLSYEEDLKKQKAFEDKQTKLFEQGYKPITPKDVYADTSFAKIYYTTEDSVNMKQLGYFNHLISSCMLDGEASAHVIRWCYKLLFSNKLHTITVTKSDATIYSYRQLNKYEELAELIELTVSEIYENYNEYLTKKTNFNQVRKSIIKCFIINI